MDAEESASPLTLQLAARVERVAPPSIAEIGAATALATLRLLADPRSGPGGPWHDAVTAWNGSHIRKLVRRARGAAWDRAQEVAGVTAHYGRAEVRAFVPGPQAYAPPEVHKLQIQAPPLPAPTEIHHLPPLVSDTGGIPPGSAARERKVSDTMVLAVTPELWMSWGKQAAQCAHGAQRLVELHPAASGWLDQSSIVVVHPCSVLWGELGRLDPVEIRDGGYTEIPAGTLTLRALWRPERPGI